MKAIQITVDEALLRKIDADPEARRVGRSAFLRKAASEYIARRRAREIRDAYRRGYGRNPVREDENLVVAEAQAWPED